MRAEDTLGRLVVSTREPAARQLSPLRLALWQIVLLLLGAAVVAFGALWWRGYLWGNLGPRKIVVRGCELLPASDVVSRLQFSGTESVAALWLRARGDAGRDDRWLKGLAVSSTWGRVAVVDVSERRPLLLLKSGAKHYWLCDDGWLVVRLREDDQMPQLSSILALPTITLAEDPGPGAMTGATELLFVAGACDQLLPGVMAKLERTREGKLRLYEKSGFPIYLGDPDHLEEKLGALPKALRVCEDHKHLLRYLDASDHHVFYEKWKEAQQ